MTILKCKMCGGSLTIGPEATVCECEYCGSTQTIPKVDDEKKITLYERANRLRFNCEFDKAASVYESIVADFHEEAESYWGLILCKYGIEYVDDPATGKKVPTCHRSSFDSVMEDADFEMVMENADTISRRVYREEAKQIEEIRKGIIEVSGKEEPYDIFICYKETADDGSRTIDSVLAQDVYDALIDKGYRVFFSRITLEDKLGTEYEPYIFAALNSAKVMLAFGTTYDYYNAVWVKNEWSRYLKLMAADKSKHLIPCYKDIDAYDIPKEFAKLQAQDLGKVGATQDLLRGIDKILNPEGKVSKSAQQSAINTEEIGAAIASAVSATAGSNIDALMQRGFMALEDTAYTAAKQYFDEALNMNAQNGKAYLGLFMAKFGIPNMAVLEQKFLEDDRAEYWISKDSTWKRAKEFAQGELKQKLVAMETARLEKEKSLVEAENARKRADAEKKIFNKNRLLSLQQQLRENKFDLPEDKEEEYKSISLDVQGKKETLEKILTAYESQPAYLELTEIESQIKQKEEVISKLGLFQMKEKKATKEELAALESKRAELLQKLQGEKEKVDNAQQQLAQAEEGKQEFLDDIKMAVKKEIISLYLSCDELKSGNRARFGQYRWVDTLSAQPISWIVGDVTETKVLLISEFGLDLRAFREDKDYKTNEKERPYTWDKSDIRTWLNDDFCDEAFNEQEQKLIVETNVTAEENTETNADPGKDTIDKVFLLSLQEVTKYLPTPELSKCTPTPYTEWQEDRERERGVSARILGPKKSHVGCWTRTSGRDAIAIAVVWADGSIDYKGMNACCEMQIRPAIWIDFSDDTEMQELKMRNWRK